MGKFAGTLRRSNSPKSSGKSHQHRTVQWLSPYRPLSYPFQLCAQQLPQGACSPLRRSAEGLVKSEKAWRAGKVGSPAFLSAPPVSRNQWQGIAPIENILISNASSPFFINFPEGGSLLLDQDRLIKWLRFYYASYTTRPPPVGRLATSTLTNLTGQ